MRSFIVTPRRSKNASSGTPARASISTLRCSTATSTGPRARTAPPSTTGVPRRQSWPITLPGPRTACGSFGGGGGGGRSCSTTSSARLSPAGDRSLASRRRSMTSRALSSVTAHRQSDVSWSERSMDPASAAAWIFFLASRNLSGGTSDTTATSFAILCARSCFGDMDPEVRRYSSMFCFSCSSACKACSSSALWASSSCRALSGGLPVPSQLSSVGSRTTAVRRPA
mmetsp:Transcript_78302/g.204100  ORF Transcript_78302/g.204100 Transcript_78302/m.204100 type:complete len:227 (+) Transcript_78302:1953-2633(+)